MDLLNIILIIAIFVVYFTTKKKANIQSYKDNTPKVFPYKKKVLLTKTEYSFYNNLKPLCDNANLIICPKVRMEDFLEVTDKQHHQKYRGYIKSRHIDFLICDNKLHMIAGIELDDKSHNQEKAKQTDEFKNQVFKTIDVPLYRIKVSNGMYNDQIIKIINELSSNKTLSLTQIPTVNTKEVSQTNKIPQTKETTPTKTPVNTNYFNLP